MRNRVMLIGILLTSFASFADDEPRGLQGRLSWTYATADGSPLGFSDQRLFLDGAVIRDAATGALVTRMERVSSRESLTVGGRTCYRNLRLEGFASSDLDRPTWPLMPIPADLAQWVVAQYDSRIVLSEALEFYTFAPPGGMLGLYHRVGHSYADWFPPMLFPPFSVMIGLRKGTLEDLSRDALAVAPLDYAVMLPAVLKSSQHARPAHQIIGACLDEREWALTIKSAVTEFMPVD